MAGSVRERLLRGLRGLGDRMSINSCGVRMGGDHPQAVDIIDSLVSVVILCSEPQVRQVVRRWRRILG